MSPPFSRTQRPKLGVDRVAELNKTCKTSWACVHSLSCGWQKSKNIWAVRAQRNRVFWRRICLSGGRTRHFFSYVFLIYREDGEENCASEYESRALAAGWLRQTANAAINYPQLWRKIFFCSHTHEEIFCRLGTKLNKPFQIADWNTLMRSRLSWCT